MLRSRPWWVFLFICVVTFLAILVVVPSDFPVHQQAFGRDFNFNLGIPGTLTVRGKTINLPRWELKKGLDIQGGLQVTLEADMSQIPEGGRDEALKGAREVVNRRVDLYGLSETSVITSHLGDSYRIVAELPGVTNTDEALQLIGQTAQLDFRLEKPKTASDSSELAITFDDFVPTGLTGKQLLGSQVQFDPQTGQPTIAIQFDPVGTEMFSQITTNGQGQRLGIFIDNSPVALPTINDVIANGQAVISGGFTEDQAKQLAIQLSAGSLPVPLQVVGQRNVGASLGQEAINQTITAGLVGLFLVMLFMLLNYGYKGIIAVMALGLYTLYTIAIYKILGVTLTVSGIAGLLLTIGMAVDSNILIFERMKEELRLGRPFKMAMERGFGRAWNSIKDANVITILIAIVLINPLHFSFLNTSGLVRGFGITLLVGMVVGLFTGIVVTRNFMRLFLKEPKDD